MDNKNGQQTQTKRHLPWSGISIFVITFSVLILITVFSFSFYKISYFGKALQIAVSDLKQHEALLQTQVDNSAQQFQQTTDALKQTVDEIRQSQSGDRNAWKVIEAQYYVNLADTNLQFENNVSIAIQLLQVADNQLRDINDPKLDLMRKALADDVARLQTVPAIDYTGLYLQLSALNDQVDKLPLLTKPVASSTDQSSGSENAVWWKRGLQESWLALQKIVVVRYHAAGTPPLVTPDEQNFLYQNLHAMFQQAMWAVLNKNPNVYRESVHQISQWIETYFVKESSTTQAMLNHLTQLDSVNLRPTVPPITASVQAFHDYFANGGH